MMNDQDDINIDIDQYNKIRKSTSKGKNRNRSSSTGSNTSNSSSTSDSEDDSHEGTTTTNTNTTTNIRSSTSSTSSVPPKPKNKKKSSKSSGDDIVISHPSGFKQATPPIPSASSKPSIFSLGVSPILQQYQQIQEEDDEQPAEKIYFKVSPQLLQDVAKWEHTKQGYERAIQGLLSQKSKMLDALFDGYLQEMIPILDQHNFDSSFKNELIQRERDRLEASKTKLFGTGNASINALESQIEKKKKEINMHNKITLIQAVVRGWLAKRRYKEMKKRIEKRNKCVSEIVETERTYVNSLSLIISQFLTPLQTTRKDLLTTSEINNIFSNCNALFGVHHELLESLEKQWKDWNSHHSTIADCFQPLIPYLKLYTQYINNFNNAINTLNDCKKKDSKVNQFFFKDCRTNIQLKGKDFLDLQIQPVQRIPRYKLLFTELLQNTPTIHKDYELISKALRAIQLVASTINESKRNAEGLEKMIQIQGSLTSNIELVQPHRRHLKEGNIMFEKRGVLKDRTLFLFNDSMLLCKKKPNIMLLDNQPRYSVVTHLKLTNCIVLPTEQPGSDSSQLIRFGFAVLGREHLYFYTKNAIEQLEWIELFKNVVKEADTNNSTLRKDESDSPVEPASLVRESHSRMGSQLGSSVANPNRLSTRLELKNDQKDNGHSSTNVPIVIERNSRILNGSGGSSSPPLNNNNNSSPPYSSSSSSTLSFNNNQQQQQQLSSPTLSSTISTSTINYNNNNYNNNSSPPNNSQRLSSNLSTTFSTISFNPSTNQYHQPIQQNQQQQSSQQQQQYQNKSIRELIDIVIELNGLYGQLFMPLDKLQMILGDYTKQFPVSNVNQTIISITETLNKIVNIKNRSIELLKEENLSKQLQEVILQGRDNIGSFNEWIKRSYPNNDLAGQQPRFLVINLMKWYNNLHCVWKLILDFDQNKQQQQSIK